tara:strand:- start:34 stop:1362 length:1329 start_codon:yes stop_codon:yes gene_type:complete
MASATSNQSVVNFGTSVRNRETRYYNTDVTTLGDGGLKREVYRTDERGENRVLIKTVNVDSQGNETTEVSDNILDDERRALNISGSSLNNALKEQTQQATTIARTNELQASAGGQTDVGKNNAKILAGNTNDADNDNDNAESKPSNEMGPVASAGGTETSYGNYRYPIDIAISKQDVIKFDIYEYIPQQFTADGGGGVYASNARRNAGGRKSIGSIILPIPAGIQDAKSVDWGGGSMNAIDIAKADVALTAIMDGIKPGLDKVGDYANVIKRNPDDAKKGIAAYFAGQAAGKGQQVLQRTTGMVMNPNMELLFNGPSLRTFTFVFFLSPRSKDEATQVKKIIRTFKQSMSPIRSKSNLFLKSPNTYGLRYLHRGEDGGLHKGLNAFKECAMTGFSVDYTPTGNYATYSDGTPVQYQMSMTFNELEPIFNDEYDDKSDEYIGF